MDKHMMPGMPMMKEMDEKEMKKKKMKKMPGNYSQGAVKAALAMKH